MKNLLVNCSKPAIILNPNLKDIILLHGHCYLNHERFEVGYNKSKWYIEFPYRKFARVKSGLNQEDLDRYYVVDGDGEHLPLFLCVPCGKCPICTERKATDWKTRAMCESQVSCSPPIFFTLTYNDFCLPWNGVRKGAIQRFMKRLRVNFDRYCGFKSNIRYYACAEYGSKTARAHYHGILWNLPLLMPEHVDELIEKSWSFATNKRFYDSVPDRRDKFGKPIFKFYHKEDKTYRVMYGYTRSSICTEGRVQYAMKYMRKDATIPEGKNNIFFLASRRGGIGRQWIESKVQEYRKYPSLLSVKLTDIWSSKVYEAPLPRYFKDYICPCTSRLIKKEIRDKYKQWNYYSNVFHTLIGHHYTPNPRVIKHYPTLPYHATDVYIGHRKRLAKEIAQDEMNQCHKLTTTDYFDSFTRDYQKIIDYLEWSLLQYEYDVDLAKSTPNYKKEHLKAIEVVMDAQPVQTIPDKLATIHRRRLRSKQRELL